MFISGDSKEVLRHLPDNFFDLICTDPPYGIEFMGKDWDKALPDKEIWKQCYRVLKEGKLAFVMCSPRQDVLSRMIISLEDAGFRTNYTSIYWTYASGFPKAANISKLIDKRNGRGETEYKQLGDYIKSQRIKLNISTKDITQLFPSKTGGLTGCLWNWENGENVPTVDQWIILKHELDLDNRFDELIERTEAEREIIGKDGRTAKESKFNLGIQKEWDITKPATDEAKKMEGAYVGFQPKPAVEVILIVSKGKTLTWLDDCRIPYQSEDDVKSSEYGYKKGIHHWNELKVKQGDRKETVLPRSDEWNIGFKQNEKGRFPANLLVSDDVLNVFEKDYSRYFDLDKWWQKFIITPKASKSERGENNSHPTVKAIKLMSYLITLGSREGDLVLDPFVGSGTTYKTCLQLHRKCIGIEINKEYIEIAKARISPLLKQTKLVP